MRELPALLAAGERRSCHGWPQESLAVSAERDFCGWSDVVIWWTSGGLQVVFGWSSDGFWSSDEVGAASKEEASPVTAMRELAGRIWAGTFWLQVS